MNVNAVSRVSFGATLQSPVAKKIVNRSLLKAPKSDLKVLCGPEELKKAKAIVAINVAENAGIAAGMAQMPGWDELALSANEIKMAMEIYNGVYNFGFDKTTVKSILTGFIGNRIGTWLFKGASKLVTWMPGVGNGLNATVAGTTTAALGAAIVSNAEEMDRARRNGQSLEKFLKSMEK